MEFFGQQGSFLYTIKTSNSKVEYVLVESVYTEYRRLYLRTKQLNALEISPEIFRKAVNQYCKNDPANWEKIYNELQTDSIFSEWLLDEYKKFISPFLETTIHQALMKQQE